MRRRTTSASASSRPVMTVDEVETMFITKLSEKYQLTDRDLQRAFRKFDKDGNGYLNLEELTGAIRLFLNGIDDVLVRQLASIYDVDGDGQISVVEFTSNLLTRSSNPTSITPHASSSTSTSSASQMMRSSSISSSMIQGYDTNNQPAPIKENSNPIQYQSKVFLDNMKAILMKKANLLIKENKIPLQHRLMSHHDALVETIGRDILIQDFQSTSRDKDRKTLYDFTIFNHVMKKFVYPGAMMPNDDVLSSIYLICSSSLASSSSRSASSSTKSSSSCDPNMLADILFAKTTSHINQFGFIQPIIAATDLNRPIVSKGPIIDHVDDHIALHHLPKRMITKQSHTGLAMPSDFSIDQLHRSNKMPDQLSLTKDHIIGMMIKPSSGQSFLSIPVSSNQMMILYSVGKLLIIYDVVTHDQIYLEGHNNDVSCYTISSDYQYIASGQLVHKDACIIIWDNPVYLHDPSSSSSCQPLFTIGKGFFAKGVSCIAITYDNTYICGITNDDKHMLGIWNLVTHDMIISMTSATGIPPQIISLSYCPHIQNTSYISKDHMNYDCDMFITAGCRHLKFWSFQRPHIKAHHQHRHDNPSSCLISRSYSMGKMKNIDVAKIFTTVDYVLYDDNRIQHVLVGGDNGIIYCFRDNHCINANQVVAKDGGGINHVIVHGAMAYIAGGGGSVVVISVLSLDVVRSYNVNATSTSSAVSSSSSMMSSIMNPSSSRPSSSRPSSSSLRPKSSSISSSTRISRPKSSSRPHSSSSSSSMISSSMAVAGASSTRSESRGTRRIVVKDNIVSLGEKVKSIPVDGIPSSYDIQSIGVIYDDRRQVTAIIAASKIGKMYIINTSSSGIISSTSMRPSSSGLRPSSSGIISSSGMISTYCHYHTGALYALAVSKQPPMIYFATGGDDRWLCIWSASSYEMIIRGRTRNAIRAIDIANMISYGSSGSYVQSTSCIAVGSTYGYVMIYTLNQVNTKFQSQKERMNPDGRRLLQINSGSSSYGCYEMIAVVTVRDSVRDISDIKYNADATCLAVGSHDRIIYIYSHTFEAATPEKDAYVRLSCIKRLKGHSSYITHLDWSYDSMLLRSTCGAYELLFWNVIKSKQYLNSSDSLESDTQWLSDTCIISFQMMGIWPPHSDGTDINSVAVSHQLRIIITGDDHAMMNMMNYPCVMKHAPRISYAGHGSHVMMVKIVASDGRCDDKIISVGGDGSIIIWKIHQ